VVIPVGLAAVLSRAHFSAAERPVIRLWQLIGTLSAVYSLLHYPLLPLAHADTGGMGVYAVLVLAWALSAAGGFLCYRIPTLAILPPAFLLWSNTLAFLVTGLPTTTYIDVAPLTEVSTCIGLGLLVNLVSSRLEQRFWHRTVDTGFAPLLLLVAIGVHLANYFWSFWQKLSLPGPWGAWVTENNPVYIFLTALDDGHILFSGYPRLVAWEYEFLDAVHVYSNAAVLACQAAAILAFFLPKRGFLVLLFLLDVMHLSIIAIVGANFWPWIILNLLIAIVVASPDYRPQPVVRRLVATGFILIAPSFVYVAALGWFDTGANNKLFFQAVDESGRRYDVPSNFFTFYSYSIGHMDYGSPDPATAFVTEDPNGAAYDYALFQAGRRCDVAALEAGTARGFDHDRLPAFVRNYHRLALAIGARLGSFPYDVYPHHFYVPFSASADFDALDKRRVLAYIYRRESVCLSFEAGALHRKVMATAEYRIDVDGANRDAGTRR
jgi:hypothetical protein